MLLSPVMCAKPLGHRNVNIMLYINQIYVNTIIHRQFTVFRMLTDFVCLYNYEFWLSLCKIVRSSEFGNFVITFICERAK